MKRPSSTSPNMDKFDVSEYDGAVESTPSPPPTSSPASKKAKKSPTKPRSTPKTSYKDKRIEPSSPKGKLLAYCVKLAMKTADKGDVERMTGLNPTQTRALMREDGNGSLYNALMRVAEQM